MFSNVAHWWNVPHARATHRSTYSIEFAPQLCIFMVVLHSTALHNTTEGHVACFDMGSCYGIIASKLYTSSTNDAMSCTMSWVKNRGPSETPTKKRRMTKNVIQPTPTVMHDDLIQRTINSLVCPDWWKRSWPKTSLVWNRPSTLHKSDGALIPEKLIEIRSIETCKCLQFIKCTYLKSLPNKACDIDCRCQTCC